MKRLFFLFTLVGMISGIFAEETGAAAVASEEAPQKSNWQNWVFAGSALVTVAVGIVIISCNSGSTSHHETEKR